MFYDNPKCENILEYVDDYGTKSGIFLFKKIIPENILTVIENKLEKINSYNDDLNLISWYSNKIFSLEKETFELWEFISDLLYPEYVIHPQGAVIKITNKDQGMFVHADSPGKDKCHLLSQNDMWKTCCVIDFGLVAYLGNFENGSIFYPNLNKNGKVQEGNDNDCFEYQVERGDIVIHSAFHPFEHGVRNITSGSRYAFPCFVLKSKDNPGSFYNYKTEEYYDQIKNKSINDLEIWNKPLFINPQFSKEKVLEMKKSGLEGAELASYFFN